jgi:hypothetical protein
MYTYISDPRGKLRTLILSLHVEAIDPYISAEGYSPSFGMTFILWLHAQMVDRAEFFTIAEIAILESFSCVS